MAAVGGCVCCFLAGLPRFFLLVVVVVAVVGGLSSGFCFFYDSETK